LKIPSDLPYIIGGSALGVGVLAAVGAAVYYVRVVRKRRNEHKPVFVALEESEMFSNTEEEGAGGEDRLNGVKCEDNAV
jgi:hypothetical protein